MEEAQRNDWLVTGLLYISPRPNKPDSIYNLVDIPSTASRVDLRPDRSMIDKINGMMF